MTVPDFRSITVEELVRRIKSRELSATEVTDAALERIELLNPVLNAFVAVDADAARTQAADIDRALDAGSEVGPLAGVPIGVKDLADATGFQTTRGAMHLADVAPAEKDSTEVARMRAAGCVILGKTNTPEAGWTGDTFNSVFGATVSPWGHNRSPGGSSGGTSAAISSGMIPLGTGSDGGGSIRIPSSLTGLSGHKPTQGRVPSGPAPMGASDLSTVGPLARRIRDVAMVLDVVSGPSPGDLRSLDPIAPLRPRLDDPPAPARVLWCPNIEGSPVDDEILASCLGAVERMKQAGVEVVDIEPVMPEIIGPFVLLFYGGMVPTYRELFGTPAFEEITPGLRNILEGADQRLTPDAIEDARKQAQAASLRLAEVMSGFDALLSPTVVGQTPVCEGPGMINGEETDMWIGNTYPLNVTRRPAGTTASGYTSDGMPVGLQVVGHQNDDGRVLEITAWIEDLLNLNPIAPDVA